MKKSEGYKLDRFWANKVRKDHCESCLEQDIRFESAHIKGRRFRTTRWGCWIDGKYDLAGMNLCVPCHRDYDEHGRKHDFIVRVVVGQKRFEKLTDVKEVIAKYQDYEEIKGWIDEF